MELYKKSILAILIIFVSGIAFSQIADIPASVTDSVDRYFKDGRTPAFNYKGSNDMANFAVQDGSRTTLTFIGGSNQVTNFGYAQILPSGLPDFGNKISVFSTAASTMTPGSTFTITTDPGSKIGFWIEQANNPGFTTWTVDEANITRVQHAVVTADSTSQQMIIGFEDKWVGDLPSTKKVWGADLDFNDCLVSISVAPADSGSPPQGQPAPSIICTLVAGIIAIGSVGWRNIF
jgi:hypothetical protein